MTFFYEPELTEETYIIWKSFRGTVMIEPFLKSPRYNSTIQSDQILPSWIILTPGDSILWHSNTKQPDPTDTEHS